MAGFAALNLHHLVLEYERTSLIGVARVAHRVLRCGCPHLLCPNRAVRIVAVAALDQTLVHPVMERHRELRLFLQVARVTKLRLRLHQQEFRILRVMRRVAIHAANIVLVVFRPRKIHLLFARRVASEAAIIDCLRALRFEAEDLRHVHGIRHVPRSGPVASLAALMRCAAALIQHRLEVRRFLKAVV